MDLKKGLFWGLLSLVVVLIIHELFRMFRDRAVSESNALTDAKLRRFQSEVVEVITTLREETHAMVEDAKVKMLPPSGPQGKVGFAGAEPEPIC